MLSVLIVSVLTMCVLTGCVRIVSLRIVSVRRGGGVAPGRARAKVMCVRRTRPKILQEIFFA